MNFRNLSIRLRLTIGFSLMVASVALVGFMGRYGIKKAQEVVETANNLKQAKSELLTARLAVMYFIKFNEISKSEEASSFLDKALKEVKGAREHQIMDENLLDSLDIAITDYNKALRNYTELEISKQTTRQKWSEVGNKVGQLINQSTQINRIEALAKNIFYHHSDLRIAAWQFVGNQIDKRGNINRAAVAAIDTKLNSLDSLLQKAEHQYGGAVAKNISELRVGYQDYKEAFNLFVIDNVNQGKYMRDMQVEGATVMQLSDHLSVVAAEKEANIIHDFLVQLRTILLIALILGVVISRTTSISIVKPVEKGMKLAEALARGELFHSFSNEGKDEISRLMNALNRMNIKLRDVVSEIISGSQQLTMASEQLSQNSQLLTQGATEQAASLEEVSTTMEEIVANIEQNLENANSSEKQSVEALDGIKKTASDSQKAMDANKTITDKINVVTKIANQTNILALNAAVEAARAGEQGRGFSVVAREVRKLAERSQQAADEIVKIAQESNFLSVNSNTQLHEILPAINKSSDQMKEISAATSEQRLAVNQINEAIQQLNQTTQHTASSSEELSSNAEELSAQAVQLRSLINYFRLKEQDRKASDEEAERFVTEVDSNLRINANKEDTIEEAYGTY